MVYEHVDRALRYSIAGIIIGAPTDAGRCEQTAS
jgi:hypothetical protein